MRAVDDVVLPLLRSAMPTAEQVHDAQVTADNRTKVVTYKLPYLVYSSSPGDDNNRRGRRHTRRSVFVALKYVGESREQVKWCVERIRPLLQDQRLIIPGHKSWPVNLEMSTRVWRDDDAVRPDGSPLFYCDEEYGVPITMHTFRQLTQEATP